MCRDCSSKIARRSSCERAHHASDFLIGISAALVASGRPRLGERAASSSCSHRPRHRRTRRASRRGRPSVRPQEEARPQPPKRFGHARCPHRLLRTRPEESAYSQPYLPGALVSRDRPRTRTTPSTPRQLGGRQAGISRSDGFVPTASTTCRSGVALGAQHRSPRRRFGAPRQRLPQRVAPGGSGTGGHSGTKHGARGQVRA